MLTPIIAQVSDFECTAGILQFLGGTARFKSCIRRLVCSLVDPNLRILTFGTLTGHGVGNADASATDALLLTILQDIFGRLVSESHKLMSSYYSLYSYIC